jgi:hypothetical protein
VHERLLSVLAQYGPVLDEPISHDPPGDLIPEPFNSLLWLAVGVALVVGRRRIAGFFESMTGWGPVYRSFCEWACGFWGVLLVVVISAGAVASLL